MNKTAPRLVAPAVDTQTGLTCKIPVVLDSAEGPLMTATTQAYEYLTAWAAAREAKRADPPLASQTMKLFARMTAACLRGIRGPVDDRQILAAAALRHGVERCAQLAKTKVTRRNEEWCVNCWLAVQDAMTHAYEALNTPDEERRRELKSMYGI